ncbi:MAG: hypothetical protein ACON4H_16205 [Rubripirellula sp.]
MTRSRKTMLHACLFWVTVTFTCATLGCSSNENTVIQPGSQEPTAEEAAAYEQEVEEMNSERD